MNAESCSCSTPLLETIHSCKRCGRDLHEPKHALGRQGQAMALLVADYVVEILEAKTSRQKPGKDSTHVPVQLELGGAE